MLRLGLPGEAPEIAKAWRRPQAELFERTADLSDGVDPPAPDDLE